MAEGELTLLGLWVSVFVIRVRMVLEQKGLSYEYLEEEDLYSNKSELLLKHNPIHKKVPVLIHDDRSICEPLVILQYIHENWHGIGPSVLPVDPYDRAVARFWAQYIDEKFLYSFIGIMTAATEEEKQKKIAGTIEILEQLEGAFEKCSGEKDFFGGDSVGFLDVTLGSQLAWIIAVEKISDVKLLDETKVSLLVQWSNRFLKLEFVKTVLPSVERVEDCGRQVLATRWNPIAPAK